MPEPYDRKESQPELRAEYAESAQLLNRVGKGLEIGAYACALGAVIAVKLTGGDESSPAEWSDIPRLAPYLAPALVSAIGSKVFYKESARYTEASEELI